MKLKSSNRYISFFIALFSFFPIYAEEEIDIWNREKEKNLKIIKEENESPKPTINTSIFEASKQRVNNNINIQDEIIVKTENTEIFGIYEPADSDFGLTMWSQTKAEDVRSSITRIKKIKLSKVATNLFEKTLFSFAYPPKGMSDKEFTDLKIEWMIDNKRSDLIEQFLNRNNTFYKKKKAIQYLVDENIAKANIKNSCEKISFMDKNIKDPYLEKFKIYCLIFNDKKNEAQLLYDILREQNQSDEFFDNKINFLLGITNKTSNKVKEDNLLNFYLSSITIKEFKYEPTEKTKKVIWEYLNAANLIKLEDITDREKLKSLEIAANQNQLDKQKIFDIYKKIPFDLNALINANNIYQTLDNIDSRALIYQKFLLTDRIEAKIEILFLLDELFKKDNLSNVYAKFLSDRLKEFNLENIPETYKEVVQKNIISEEEFKMGKVKYDDKVLHRSKIIKYYIDNEDKKKTQKDFDKIYKKIKKNKKYFYSAKDFALLESLAKDGIKIPKDLNYQELLKKYDVPENLLQLAKNNEPAFLALKIVEIIGEDEPYNLDAETIYFITHLLNQTNLKKIRNKILVSALPLRS